jgi:hypothetical protein
VGNADGPYGIVSDHELVWCDATASRRPGLVRGNGGSRTPSASPFVAEQSEGARRPATTGWRRCLDHRVATRTRSPGPKVHWTVVDDQDLRFYRCVGPCQRRQAPRSTARCLELRPTCCRPNGAAAAQPATDRKELRGVDASWRL